MHFVGMNGMPRRTYRYDAGQGWETENMLETIGASILVVATAILVYNLLRSRRSGAVAGNDPWGAPTLEWTLPSPPPEYNYARIPKVTSRYPLWDVKAPRLTADVPHTKAGEKRTTVEVAGKETGTSFKTPSDSQMNAENAHPTARQLDILMPTPTVKPLVAALGLTIAFVGLIWHKQLPVMLLGGAIFVAALYSWLLTPLEEEH
jgi:cytochrome c oxidase subunit I